MKNRWVRILLVAAVGLAACPAASIAQEAMRYGDIIVERPDLYEMRGPSETWHGYFEHEFNVTNKSPTQTHEVTITFSSERSRYQQGMGRLRKTVNVAPGATVNVKLYQPAMHVEDRAEISIDGRTQEEAVAGMNRHGSPGYSHYYSSSRPEKARILASTEACKKAQCWVNTSLPGGNGMTRHKKPLSAWSDNWLAYSAFDIVLLSPIDWQRAGAGVRCALLQYVRSGGILTIAGAWELPADIGGRIVKQDLMQLGFGLIVRVDQFDLSKDDLQTYVDQTTGIYDRQQEISAANEMFPVTDAAGVPLRGMFLLVLIFALAVGPINVFLIARKSRRIWMLWTVPVMSLIACGIIFGYSLLSEGLGIRQHTSTLTILDQDAHEAATIGWTAYYSPLTVSRPLAFDYSSELTPQIENGYFGYSRDNRRAFGMDWTGGQNLDLNWLAARVPLHLSVRKVQQRHEQLAFNELGEGKLEVVNGLGSGVQKLTVAWHDGKVYAAGPIPAGARAILNHTGAAAAPSIGDIRQLLDGEHFKASQRLTGEQYRYLSAGTYVAELDESVFLEQAIPVKEHNQQAVVLGVMRASNAN